MPILYARCEEWAAASGGAVAATGGARGPPAQLGMSAVAAWIRRGGIKSPARAADKAIACYGGDASRLLDVARARLLFASAAALGRCLGLVAGAAGVRVVRVSDSLLSFAVSLRVAPLFNRYLIDQLNID